jgi:hypothetical protein
MAMTIDAAHPMRAVAADASIRVDVTLREMRIAANMGRNPIKPVTAPSNMPSAVLTFTNLPPFVSEKPGVSSISEPFQQGFSPLRPTKP